MCSMDKLNLIPKISTHSFIYHFKSVTVKTAAKMNRANHAENRNNLTLFHNENQTILHYPALYKSYTELYPHSFIPHIYPVPVVPSVVGVVSDNATTLTNHQAKVKSLRETLMTIFRWWVMPYANFLSPLFILIEYEFICYSLLMVTRILIGMI